MHVARAVVQRRTDGGTGIPARRSGAGRGSPNWVSSGTTPAQAPPATSSGSSSGHCSETRSDHCSIGIASSSVAASSRGVAARTSPTRPGRSLSTTTSRAARFTSPSTAVNRPNSTALRYWNDDSNAERATTSASSEVTVTQASAPSASSRSHPEPVEPCTSSRSPSRAIPVGTTSGWPSRTRPTWATYASSSSARSAASSVTAFSGIRVIEVFGTRRSCHR